MIHVMRLWGHIGNIDNKTCRCLILTIAMITVVLAHKGGVNNVEAVPPPFIDVAVEDTLAVQDVNQDDSLGVIDNTTNEVYLLAQLVEAEAEGESLRGKIAVAQVVLNRIKSDQFPNNIEDVIYQSVGGVYQFSPVVDGRITNQPTKESLEAAQQAMAGVKVVGDSVLYFYNPNISRCGWITNRQTEQQIGNHIFAY